MGDDESNEWDAAPPTRIGAKAPYGQCPCPEYGDRRFRVLGTHCFMVGGVRPREQDRQRTPARHFACTPISRQPVPTLLTRHSRQALPTFSSY